MESQRKWATKVIEWTQGVRGIWHSAVKGSWSVSGVRCLGSQFEHGIGDTLWMCGKYRT